MDFLESLQQLKHLAPDPDYAQRSKNVILSHPYRPTARFRPLQIFFQTLQSGLAVVFAGVLLLLLVGGFSAWKFLSPFRLAGLDPSNLRAEAHAIDIQVELANIRYDYTNPPEEPQTQTTLPVFENRSTTAPVALRPEISALKREAKKKAESLGLAPIRATSTLDTEGTVSATSIDEALQLLSE